MYWTPIANTKKPMILEIATIPEAPRNLDKKLALRNVKNTVKDKAKIDPTIMALSEYSG